MPLGERSSTACSDIKKGGLKLTENSIKEYARVIGMPRLIAGWSKTFLGRARFYEFLFGALIVDGHRKPVLIQPDDLKDVSFQLEGAFETNSEFAYRMFTRWRGEQRGKRS